MQVTVSVELELWMFVLLVELHEMAYDSVC